MEDVCKNIVEDVCKSILVNHNIFIIDGAKCSMEHLYHSEERKDEKPP